MVNTVCKKRNILRELNFDVSHSLVKLPAVVLEGLHYDVLLGVNWLTEFNSIINVREGSKSIETDKLEVKGFPQPVANYLEAKTQVYLCERVSIRSNKIKTLKLMHDKLSPQEMCMFISKNPERLCGEAFVETDNPGRISKLRIKN